MKIMESVSFLTDRAGLRTLPRILRGGSRTVRHLHGGSGRITPRRGAARRADGGPGPGAGSPGVPRGSGRRPARHRRRRRPAGDPLGKGGQVGRAEPAHLTDGQPSAEAWAVRCAAAWPASYVAHRRGAPSASAVSAATSTSAAASRAHSRFAGASAASRASKARSPRRPARNRQGWVLDADGAQCAASRSRSSWSAPRVAVASKARGLRRSASRGCRSAGRGGVGRGGHGSPRAMLSVELSIVSTGACTPSFPAAV